MANQPLRKIVRIPYLSLLGFSEFSTTGLAKCGFSQLLGLASMVLEVYFNCVLDNIELERALGLDRFIRLILCFILHCRGGL